MNFDIEKYKRLFLTESKEHLENITKILEKTRESFEEEEINVLFREAHSLKGMAAAMGYNKISEIAHGMENLMHEIRSGKLSFSDVAKEKLISSNDMLWRLVEAIEAGNPLDNITESIETSSKVTEGPLVQSDVQTKVGEPISIEIIFDENVPSLFARAFLVYKNIESFGNIKKSDPDLADIKKGNMGNIFKIELYPAKPIEPLKAYLSKVKEIKSISYHKIHQDAENIKIEDKEEKKDIKTEDKLILPQSVKVDINFLDNFVNITGELLTIKSKIRENTKNIGEIEISNALNQMEILLKDLQEKVMRLRLMPLDTIFSRIPRWVRDLSKKLNKMIDVEISGENIELDRAVVEALFDPILHVIRNCADHGIEDPAERERIGKPRKGKIEVRAEKDRENIIVKIIDDGRGINTDKVFKKAQSSGKFNQEYLDSLKTRKEKLYLVTYPGISTKDDVTEISGRGVGLDVVKSTLESFGGSFDLDSEEGKGTTVSLVLGSSISIINVLLFSLDKFLFGTPVDKIIRILNTKTTEIREIGKNSYTFFYEEQHIPLHFLHDCLNVDKNTTKQECSVIILSVKGVLTAVVVDEFLGHKEVYLRSLNPPLSFIPGFYSSTILGDGSPALILDIQGVLR